MQKLVFLLLVLSAGVYAAKSGRKPNDYCSWLLYAQWETEMAGDLATFIDSVGGQMESIYGPRDFFIHAARQLNLPTTAEAFAEQKWNIMEGHLLRESPWARRRLIVAFGKLMQAYHQREGRPPQAFPNTIHAVHVWGHESGLIALMQQNPMPPRQAIAWPISRTLSIAPSSRVRGGFLPPEPVAKVTPIRQFPARHVGKKLSELWRFKGKDMENALLLLFNELDAHPELFLNEADIESLKTIWRCHKVESIRDVVVAIVVQSAPGNSPAALSFFRYVIGQFHESAAQILMEPRFGHLASAEVRNYILFGRASEDEEDDVEEEESDAESNPLPNGGLILSESEAGLGPSSEVVDAQ